MIVAVVPNPYQNLANSFLSALSMADPLERTRLFIQTLSVESKFTIHQTFQGRLDMFEKMGWYQVVSLLSVVAKHHFRREFEASNFTFELRNNDSELSFRFFEKLYLRNGLTRESQGRISLVIAPEENRLKIRDITVLTHVVLIDREAN